MNAPVLFYVCGGVYSSDAFDHCIKEDAPLGPFADWKDAHDAWADVSWRHLDEALRRYEIRDGKGAPHNTPPAALSKADAL